MRRARIAVAVIPLALALCAPAPSRAVSGDTRISSVGILDYSKPPTFKVGDYVRYLVSSIEAPSSVEDRYYLTALVAGQEVFWGERCFWLETATEYPGRPPSLALTLMSYDIFNDSLPQEHIMDYERKLASDNDSESGEFVETLVAPTATSLTLRTSRADAAAVRMDTTGVDTTRTPVGTFQCRVAVRHSAWDKTGSAGDSTLYKVRREDHTLWLTDDVPMTHSARDELTITESRRTWLVGRSKEGLPEQVIATKQVIARLVEFGHGMKSRLLPAARARAFDEPPARRKSAPVTRPRVAAGGARR